MRRGTAGRAAGICMAAVLSLAGFTRTHAAATDRPAVVGMIEQDFNGFFLLVTNGDGQYDVFQKLDDGLGLADDANVVCMPRDMCFLELAHVRPDGAAAYGEEGHAMGGLRRRLAAVRDTYGLMHAAAPEKRQAGIEAWRRAVGELATCLQAGDTCR